MRHPAPPPRLRGKTTSDAGCACGRPGPVRYPFPVPRTTPGAIGAVVARFVHTEEVTGSNPVSPTHFPRPQASFSVRDRRFPSPLIGGATSRRSLRAARLPCRRARTSTVTNPRAETRVAAVLHVGAVPDIRCPPAPHAPLRRRVRQAPEAPIRLRPEISQSADPRATSRRTHCRLPAADIATAMRPAPSLPGARASRCLPPEMYASRPTTMDIGRTARGQNPWRWFRGGNDARAAS
jgi:hypothetical protein